MHIQFPGKCYHGKLENSNIIITKKSGFINTEITIERMIWENEMEKMKRCTLCPRNCKVDRKNGETGVCGQTEELLVARAALHYWEEPCISGKEGSGAVFFSGCGLHCVFCQNRNIANGNVGKKITVERLSEIFLELQEKGANNINLVTPGHFVPQIVTALVRAKAQGLVLPVVYNTSSYECVDTLKRLEGLVDIYLPDFKYMDAALGVKYSHAPDYSTVAKAAVAEMVRQTGAAEFFAPGASVREEMRATAGAPGISVREEMRAAAGAPEKSHGGAGTAEAASVPEDAYDPVEAGCLMRRGTIVRHLLLPGCTEDSRAILRYLHETYGDDIYISIMNQFTPLPGLEKYPELNRKVTEAEYEEVVDYAIELGVERGFIQEGETAEESFIPEFDGEGV